jgi:hypothetical protein
MLLKEWNDSLIQVIQTPHSISHPVAVIRANHAAPEELLQCMKQLDVSLVLNNCELRKHLKSGGHLGVWIDADEETTFAVYKSDYPLRLQP